MRVKRVLTQFQLPMIAALALSFFLLDSCGATLPSRALAASSQAWAAGRSLTAAAPPSTPVAGKELAPVAPEMNTEEYRRLVDNPFLSARDNPLSTFSIDVDTASWANVRRFLEGNQLPPPDAVRLEELVNYFKYDYPPVEGPEPVEARFAMGEAPWNPAHILLRIALRAKDVPVAELPPSNLVFLLDTSGSMEDENKLPLLKRSLRLLVEKLRDKDSVAIVAYAGSAGLVLPPTTGDRKDVIISAFDRLEAGGSTAGGSGIELAYDVAKRNFVTGGNNRVILCTDGDFNVGTSSTSDLDRLIERKRAENVYLTVLVFGMGNYKDDRMMTLADKGNGNYAYIDGLMEARKVLGTEIWGNLFTVAKDVKIQVEFNPAQVREYRLIGYEKRLLASEDFNDDTKDAGEVGSGQTVTAFYEIVRASSTAASSSGSIDPLAFQSTALIPSEDLLVFKLRYKLPGDGKENSRLVTSRVSLADSQRPMIAEDLDFRFATSVVELGMLLRNSPYKGRSNWDSLIERARAAKGRDSEGYRAEFVRLAEIAKLLSAR